MIVMLASNTGIRAGYFAGRYPGRIGHLFSPGDQKGPFEFCDYSLDNGAFLGKWTLEKWVKLLEWAKLSDKDPRWILVPDIVSDRDGTLALWREHSPLAARYGWPLAFAVQDGMTPKDVPANAEVVFVGGSTFWKWQSLPTWCKAFHRVHVGRVNTYRRLWTCHDNGAESIDGTGWLRGNQKQYRGLAAYLAESSGETKRAIQGTLEESRALHFY